MTDHTSQDTLESPSFATLIEACDKKMMSCRILTQPYGDRVIEIYAAHDGDKIFRSGLLNRNNELVHTDSVRHALAFVEAFDHSPIGMVHTTDVAIFRELGFMIYEARDHEDTIVGLYFDSDSKMTIRVSVAHLPSAYWTFTILDTKTRNYAVMTYEDVYLSDIWDDVLKETELIINTESWGMRNPITPPAALLELCAEKEIGCVIDASLSINTTVSLTRLDSQELLYESSDIDSLNRAFAFAKHLTPPSPSLPQ